MSSPVVVSDDIVLAAKMLAETRSQIAELRKIENDQRDELLNALGESDVAVTGSGAPGFHVQRQVRKSVNSKRLEAMFPSVFEECSDETEIRVVKIDLT